MPQVKIPNAVTKTEAPTCHTYDLVQQNKQILKKKSIPQINGHFYWIVFTKPSYKARFKERKIGSTSYWIRDKAILQKNTGEINKAVLEKIDRGIKCK